MIPKINIKHLENELYSVKSTPNKICNIQYFDFQFGTSNLNSSSTSIQTISPNIMQQNITLDSSVEIEFSYYHQYNPNDDIYIFNAIKNKINNDFCKNVTILGNKHRSDGVKFDINIKEIKELYPIDYQKRIYYKLNNASNYISKESRYGPSTFFLVNNKTYDYILTNLTDQLLSYNNKNQITINSAPFIINENIDDDIIVTGRKGTLDQPGLHCVINTDDQENLNIIEQHNYGTYLGKKYILHYKIFELGNNSFKSYLNMNTKSLAYQRFKKLQKINKSQV